MSKLRVQIFAMSIDGYSAGPNQDLQNPIGVGGFALMEWFFPTRVWQRMHGHDDGETGIDNGFAEQSFAGIGAYILGRNMFGPVRGPWPDDNWKGWWGNEPPYHTPVFVLTHHPRPPLTMEGGTVFRFVGAGYHEVYSTVPEVYDRVVNLLETKDTTSPPSSLRLADLRTLCGVSQAELGNRLGISQPSVAEMEGRADILRSTLSRVAKALKIELELTAKLPDGERPPIAL